MKANLAFREFLLKKASILTEEWYNSLDQSSVSGVYASRDQATIENLKSQNFAFHKHLAEIFTLDKEAFLAHMNDWIVEIGRDPHHLETPTHEIMREFMRVRIQYLDFLKEFIETQNVNVDRDRETRWTRLLVDAFDQIMYQVVEEKSNYLNRTIEKQQSTINELSSPLIQLSNDQALLPLVGNIDTDRAAAIQENILRKCTDQDVDLLYIDLSGVYLVDTMVAQQIFHLIDSLRLIGVSSTVVGIRPEIAQTAVSLGLDFSHVTTTATLSQAMAGQTF
ncbi:STAS domain-containing protein [Halobacillus kuroshimensis]|uniref:STAS domain-containing protein n=1 Tax=Halobacillus kuroshimensis TaxID=302481 RepID=A0ABS3DX59_9BACI|nr:STAS domain-containing protein [Halobacillus kuroshimensis]MBN8235935.1 STAS domain-containing protein [Halobacillus kuroshimensis]